MKFFVSIVLSTGIALGAFMTLFARPTLVDADSSSVSNSVTVHSSSNEQTIIQNGQTIQNGGDHRTEIHVETNVNGEKHEFTKVINGMAPDFHKVFTQNLDDGEIRAEINAGGSDTRKVNTKTNLSVVSGRGSDETTKTKDESTPDRVSNKNTKESFSLSSSTVKITYQKTGSTTTATGTATSTAENKSVIISFIQKIFAYVSSFF